jgi:hypothetical protein
MELREQLLGDRTQIECLGILSFHILPISQYIRCGGPGVFGYGFIRNVTLPPEHFLFPKALLVAAIIPDFIGALACVGFLTGFWMVRN